MSKSLFRTRVLISAKIVVGNGNNGVEYIEGFSGVPQLLAEIFGRVIGFFKMDSIYLLDFGLGKFSCLRFPGALACDINPRMNRLRQSPYSLNGNY